MVVEDAHWIDPTTFELIGQSLDQIACARVLMLVTSRPDNQPALGGHPHVTRLTLNRLGRGPTEAIIARLTGDKNVPPDVLREIASRTDGVPLFVEELTKAVLEAGTTGSVAVVPASLHASLMARLDRVPGVKEVAQVAACIGREFSYPLLAAVSQTLESELRGALDRLVDAELVFCRGAPPDSRYAFKHALVRDAAHESLLRTQRQHLHGRIVRELERPFLDMASPEPEVLAEHCVAAGLGEKAVDYWLRAGQQALARSAWPRPTRTLRGGSPRWSGYRADGSASGGSSACSSRSDRYRLPGGALLRRKPVAPTPGHGSCAVDSAAFWSCFRSLRAIGILLSARRTRRGRKGCTGAITRGRGIRRRGGAGDRLSHDRIGPLPTREVRGKPRRLPGGASPLRPGSGSNLIPRLCHRLARDVAVVALALGPHSRSTGTGVGATSRGVRSSRCNRPSQHDGSCPRLGLYLSAVVARPT